MNEHSSFLEQTAQRVVAIGADVLDNLKHRSIPVFVENRETNEYIRDRFLPPEFIENLRKASERLEPGVLYGTVNIAGKKGDGSQHPHLCSVLSLPRSLEVYFIDPEHEVGEKHWIRPRVANLMALRIFQDGGLEFAALRYRTLRTDTELKTTVKGGVDNLTAQLQSARELLDRDGIPKELERYQEDISFRLLLRQNKTILQSRFLGQKNTIDLLEGKTRSAYLEGKIAANQKILLRIIALINSGAMKKKSGM